VLSSLHSVLSEVLAPPALHTAVLFTPAGAPVSVATAPGRSRDDVRVMLALASEIWAQTRAKGEGAAESEVWTSRDSSLRLRSADARSGEWSCSRSASTTPPSRSLCCCSLCKATTLPTGRKCVERYVDLTILLYLHLIRNVGTGRCRPPLADNSTASSKATDSNKQQDQEVMSESAVIFIHNAEDSYMQTFRGFDVICTTCDEPS
jgi:hypothetical protein